MIAKVNLIIILVIIASSIQSSAQTGIENVDSLAGRFIKDLRSTSKEKLFVQTNKWYYVAGEEIWMKSWIVNSLSDKYYSRSKTLFADLVDEQDTAVAQIMLNIPRQQTEGYFALPASLAEGYYWLRVYTANMVKHDTSAVFIMPLYIINNRFPSKLIAEPLVNNSSTVNNEMPQVKFFPEGGSLISGTTTMIGLRATGNTGRPLALEGYITDNWDGKDNIVSNFKTNASGVGSCSLYVYKSHPYIAHVKLNNQLLKWPLPAISQYASQLSLKEQNANNIKLIVSLGDSLYKRGKISYLLGISRDSLCFASAGSDMYEVNVSKKNFPEGRADFILFNEKLEVVSERSVYISKPNETLAIQTDKENYGPREKVSVTIITGDSLQHPSLAALSIAVTDDSLVQEPESLISLDTADLWMLTRAPHFTGKNYYNSKNDINAKLTWRDEDSTITDISGSIINRKGLPAANRIVTLYANKQINLFDTDTTDNNGAFKFHMPAYPDSVAFTLQVSNIKGVKMDEKIVVNTKSPFPRFSTPQSLKKKLSLPQAEQIQTFRSKHLDNMILGTGKEWLKEVIVKGKRKETSYNTDKRVSKFSYVLTGEKIKDINPNNAGDALLIVPGLHLKAGKLSLGGFTSYSGNQEPLLIIDGIANPEEAPETSNSSMIESSPVLRAIANIPPDIIDFVEVLKGPEAAYYGARASNGVIIINTHPRYNYGRKTESYGTLQFYPKSYYMAPPFSMPDYDDKNLKMAAFKDFRSTLYWNGHVYSDPNGKATVEFYTADPATTYTLTITGVTASGSIINKKTKINRH